MKKIATTTSDFADLRRQRCIYVDKTAYFHRLASSMGTRMYFLARPRRFGKSLMITALEAIFQGRREQFDGLAIAGMDWEWKKWPVIHFEFADVDSTSEETFERELALHIKRRLGDSGYRYDDTLSAPANFGAAIDELSFDSETRQLVDCAAEQYSAQ